MKIETGYLRLQKHHLPRTIVRCPIDSCVYNERGNCDDVFINSGNSDAKCHKFTNKKIIEMLEKAYS